MADRPGSGLAEEKQEVVKESEVWSRLFWLSFIKLVSHIIVRVLLINIELHSSREYFRVLPWYYSNTHSWFIPSSTLA